MKIEIKNLEKSYGNKKVLKNINLEFTAGHSIALLGKNGAGKSTLIKIILGLIFPDEGFTKIYSEDKQVKIGYLPEEQGMYEDVTVYDQLLYLCSLKDNQKISLGKKEVNFWLKELEMSKYSHQKLSTLSKGNQQKVQIIQAILCNPDLLILDEPFSGIDPLNALEIKKIISNEVKENKIVIISSHQLGYIEELCERVIILDEGNIVCDKDINKLLKNDFENIFVIFLKENLEKDKYNVLYGALKGLAEIKQLNPQKLEAEILPNVNIYDIIDVFREKNIEISEFMKKNEGLNEFFIRMVGG